MTLIRKLALKISDAVVEYSSPGCKEWAEGLSRETACIESDWSALCWALGSLRILFDYREAPMGSLADLPGAAKKFAKSKRNNQNATWLIMFTEGLIYCDKFFRATGWSERAGCSLVVLGAISLGTLILLQQRNKLNTPSDDDIIALVQFYRTELERLNNFSSPRWWLFGSAATCLCVGMTLAERGGVHAHPVRDAAFGLVWVSGLLLFLQIRRITRRRLERLDALLAEKS